MAARRLLGIAVVLVAVLTWSGLAFASVTSSGSALAKMFKVARVIDGDTIKLTNGKSVRLLQIDSPELQGSECYAAQAKQALSRLLPRGAKVKLQTDPALDKVDQYGRLLRYVIKRGTNLNIQLVRIGAASVWFYQGDRGRYADQLLAVAAVAQASARGLWGACPGTVFDPTQSVDTGPANPPAVYVCSDGIDNDADGKTDYPTDPGCSGPTDTSEADATFACSDGIDNDADGKTDYPADPGCTSATDADETDAPAAVCADGIDNDADGYTDYPSDTGCSSATDTAETTSTYQCDDGTDNDADGHTDFPDDPDCSTTTDTTEGTTGNCDPSYPGVCIPPPPPDLDCGDIAFTNFTVLPPDPHGFDGDHDGVGCET